MSPELHSTVSSKHTFNLLQIFHSIRHPASERTNNQFGSSRNLSGTNTRIAFNEQQRVEMGYHCNHHHRTREYAWIRQGLLGFAVAEMHTADKRLHFLACHGGHLYWIQTSVNQLRKATRGIADRQPKAQKESCERITKRCYTTSSRDMRELRFEKLPQLRFCVFAKTKWLRLHSSTAVVRLLDNNLIRCVAHWLSLPDHPWWGCLRKKKMHRNSQLASPLCVFRCLWFTRDQSALDLKRRTASDELKPKSQMLQTAVPVPPSAKRFL